jgi:glucans biosynthesis protein C
MNGEMPARGAVNIGLKPAGSRLFFVDNLRWLVIVMVVLTHACVTYSGIGLWYYHEPARLGIGSTLAFMLYQGFAQAFFMGLLFFIGGAFVPPAYDRKGFGRFIRDRLVRLGVPTLVFMLVLDPLTSLIRMSAQAAGPAQGSGPAQASIFAQYAAFVTSGQFVSASGPLWFAFALLVFSIVYAIVRKTVELLRGPSPARRPARAPVPVTHVRVAAVVLVIGIGTFLVRLVQPSGSSWFNMQLANFTQYIVLFLVGLWAARVDLLRTLPARIGWGWFRVALAAGIPAWFIIGGLGGAMHGSIDAFGGGLRWPAAAYAMWESFFGVSICLGLVVIYRERMNARTAVRGFLGDNAFGVYVFHTPILVAITMAMRGLAVPPLAKACVAFALALAASYLVAALVRQVPGLRKIFS